jgi:hypothetical protein
MYASPEVELIQKCPTPDDGLVLIIGSEEDTVASVKAATVAAIPVRLAPLIAGSVPVIFAAGIFVRLEAFSAGRFPVNLEDVKAEILASATVPVKLAAGKLVKFAPLAAGNVDGNLASAIVPDNLLAARATI